MRKLPAKSLMQFRSISKAWKSVIDSSKFVAGYSVNQHHQQHLLVSYLVPAENLENKYVSILDGHTFPQHQFYLTTPIPGISLPTILGSSQGLFCLHNIYEYPYDHGRILKFVLWNPSIRKSVTVPIVLHQDNPPFIGFGVCPRTSDPKLVKIDFDDDVTELDDVICTPWQVQVYTLSSRAWRSIPTITQPSSNSIRLMQDQVVIDGFIYLRAVDGINMTLMANSRCNLIVSFDLTHERFMEISLPDTLARARYQNVVISKLKESLVAVEIVQQAEKLVCGVWMMLEHGVPNSLFTKLFTINSPDASIQCVLGFRKNDEPLFAIRIVDNA